MNIKQFKRHHALRVMTWCKNNVGINHRRKYWPLLEWSSLAGDDNDCGDYDFEDNLVTFCWEENNNDDGDMTDQINELKKALHKKNGETKKVKNNSDDENKEDEEEDEDY